MGVALVEDMVMVVVVVVVALVHGGVALRFLRVRKGVGLDLETQPLPTPPTSRVWRGEEDRVSCVRVGGHVS